MHFLTTKSKYGIPAVLELARNYGKGLLQIKGIMRRRRLPQGYVEQLLNRLTKAGVVRAVRGKKGGYALVQDPAKVTLLKVLEALEGPLRIAEGGPEDPAIDEVFAAMESNVRKSLDISLADLLAKQDEAGMKGMFYI